MIRLGICTGIENAVLMKEIGYDYVELNLSRIAAMTDEDFVQLEREAGEAPLPVEAANSMLPGDFVLCSGEGTGERMRSYLKTAFGRAAALGIKIIVFGSGRARSLPESVSRAEGMDRLAAFLRLAGPMAAEHGIRIAIEPLRRQECNFINTVAEGQELSAFAAVPNVLALADLYHMMSGEEPYDALDNGIGVIHAHIAERLKRSYPRQGDGSDADYAEFFRRLKSAGYEGRVSIEGRSDDFAADAAAAYLLLNSLR